MTTAASSDDLFTPTETRTGWQAAVQPEYYGLLMFSQAVPPGSRLTRLTQSTTAPIQAWATRASDGTVRVVVINLDSQEQTVAVNTTAASGPATLERLEGSSATTRYGVTLGGQTFGSETTTGRLAGRQRTFKVTSRRGHYIVRMRALSAAMLTIPNGRPARLSGAICRLTAQARGMGADRAGSSSEFLAVVDAQLLHRSVQM